MNAAYLQYLRERHATYMSIETGTESYDASVKSEMDAAVEGYAGIALKAIDYLHGGKTGALVLNVPNQGAISGMGDNDIVEVSCFLTQGLIRPIAVGTIPEHALGLMKQVKAYEKMTVRAVMAGSYATALKALALHPLVPSYSVAKQIIDDYIELHGDLFPPLS
jgi:6-phospho-beta-glucosidase